MRDLLQRYTAPATVAAALPRRRRAPSGCAQALAPVEPFSVDHVLCDFLPSIVLGRNGHEDGQTTVTP